MVFNGNNEITNEKLNKTALLEERWDELISNEHILLEITKFSSSIKKEIDEKYQLIEESKTLIIEAEKKIKELEFRYNIIDMMIEQTRLKRSVVIKKDNQSAVSNDITDSDWDDLEKK